MWCSVRWICSRGRSAVPITFFRRRACRLMRCAFLLSAISCAPSLLAGLAGLAELLAHDFAVIANAFALVRLGRTQIADLCGNLSDALLIDAVDVDLVRTLDRERDARRRLERNRMGVTEREVQPVACFRCPVADALNLEALAEAF